MDVETIVVGAGVIGLAVARCLATNGHEVLVLEESDAIGSQTSSRNSEVIHAGIYYEPKSLKARHCVAGKEALYHYCQDKGVAAKAIGKLIVASDETQLPILAQIQERARRNGVMDLLQLGSSEILKLEPELSCVAGLFSPSSGIVDGHALMLALRGDAENEGAQFVLRTKVNSVKLQDDGFMVFASDEDGTSLHCRNVVNCAGLGAQKLAHSIDGYPKELIPELYLAKGNYFSVSGKSPFSHLVYPIPVAGGLGVHVTLDMSGRLRLGPDLHWVSDIDYKPDESLAPAFYQSVSAYWPGILKREINWSYAGIRPKICGPGKQNTDFMIHGERDHGIKGLVNLFGIESPGLTSSLSIADHVTDLIAGR